jgi:hypothetical protein
MTTEIKNLLNGILSLLLLIPLPTFIIDIYHSFQSTGHLIILNKVFLNTGSYLILTGLGLFSCYLLFKSIHAFSVFLLSHK